MDATMKADARNSAAVAAEANAQADQVMSFGTALIGFMLTTTLTTSLMVLLSQG
jgi:hypothetical protein